MKLLVILFVGALQAQITKNITTDFGAICNGSGNDIPAFKTFNAWAQTWQMKNAGLITLVIPAGAICEFNGTGQSPYPFLGIKHVRIFGYGAALSDNNGKGNGFFAAGKGVSGSAGHSARLASVSRGSTSVALLVPSQTSLFSAGTYALITGLDMQGYGFPPNPFYFEYVQISAINSHTGLVTLSTPLKNSYESTWPLYSAGSIFAPDEGGPATLYTLDPSWNTEVEYDGLTISQKGQTYANGRSITYKDVTFTGEACGIPSQNESWTLINATMTSCDMEVDKLIDALIFANVTIRQILFQSSSVNTFTMTGSTVTSTINGTPKSSIISNSAIANFSPGAYAYGRTDSIVCSGCSLSAISPLGVADQGGTGNPGIESTYSSGSGVLTFANSNGPARWAVPGTNMFWVGQYTNEGFPFKIIDLTQDARDTYITTSWNGGFPPIPHSTGTGIIGLRAHPAPRFTCTICTGSADAVDLSQAPPGSPIYTYSKRTYSGNIGQAATVQVWGRIVSIKINVTKPYTGIQPTLTLSVMDQFYTNTITPTGHLMHYAPLINLKIAGERDIFPYSVRGQRRGDSDLAIPGPIWFSQGFAPYLGTNIGRESPSVWPTVTIEVITDQGLPPKLSSRSIMGQTTSR